MKGSGARFKAREKAYREKARAGKRRPTEPAPPRQARIGEPELQDEIGDYREHDCDSEAKLRIGCDLLQRSTIAASFQGGDPSRVPAGVAAAALSSTSGQPTPGWT
jgi:hypothetical protein